MWLRASAGTAVEKATVRVRARAIARDARGVCDRRDRRRGDLESDPEETAGRSADFIPSSSRPAPSPALAIPT